MRTQPSIPSSRSPARPRLLILVVAYEAQSTIEDVLRRIPAALSEQVDVEVLVIDDGSTDDTFERSFEMSRAGDLPFPIRVLFNPVNQGYGGNQKIGFHYAIRNDFDLVALLHGDGQYAPECLPELVAPLLRGDADACFGSRMMERGAALRGGMPLYKYVGNRILSAIQNLMLGTALSEFHSGYRIYSVPALAQVPFALNTNDFHFDTEIIVQLFIAGHRIVEQPIPTYYGDEICRVDGLRYARDVLRAVGRARAQRWDLFYDPRFDCAAAGRANHQYQTKLDFQSPHTFALERVGWGTRVLDLGCASGELAAAIRDRGNRVVAVDRHRPSVDVELERFHQHDLDEGLPDATVEAFDVVLLLDVIEHLSEPERFALDLRRLADRNPEVEIVVSTANIGFIVNRLMLLLGQFNYGKRGILDRTHTRLFTFASLRRLFEQHGYQVLETKGIPAPFPLAIGRGRLARLLLTLNRWAIVLWRSLFSYQIVTVVRPNPTLDHLLGRANERPKASASA